MNVRRAVGGAWGQGGRVKVRNTPLFLILVLVLATVLLLPAIALANSGILGDFQTAYPSSSSDNNASCQLCHGPTTGTFNAYGKVVSGVIDADTGVPDFAAIQGLNSDGDPTGSTNIQEINAGTQPGWTAGANNTLWSRSSGAVVATNQTPPAGITGSLDPDAATPTSTSLSIKAPRKVAKGTRVKITGVLSSADAACVSAQSVDLKKGSATIGTKITSASGAYKFALKIRKKTTVQVTFAGTASCGASVSAKKTIKVA